MASPKLYVEIMILPNVTNDNPTPLEYAEKLLEETNLYYLKK